MSTDILEILSSTFQGPVSRQMSAIFGDSEAGINSGLRTGATSLLASLVSKTTQPGGLGEIYRAVSSSSVDTGLETKLAGMLGSHGNLDPALATGEAAASSILGNRLGGVSQAIAQVVGIKPSSATGLLAVAAPVLLSVLKRCATQKGLSAESLGSLLLGQRSSLIGSGLDSRITNAMGFGSLQSMLTPSAEETIAAPSPRWKSASPAGRKQSWLPWAVAAAVAAVVLGLLANRLMKRELPVIGQLPASVYFDSGTATVDASDRKTIAAVANSVKGGGGPITVTGYTDSSGDPDRNLVLAQDRATAVRDALVAEGVPAGSVILVPPMIATGSGTASDARRVEITLARAGTEAQR